MQGMQGTRCKIELSLDLWPENRNNRRPLERRRSIGLLDGCRNQNLFSWPLGTFVSSFHFKSDFVKGKKKKKGGRKWLGSILILSQVKPSKGIHPPCFFGVFRKRYFEGFNLWKKQEREGIDSFTTRCRLQLVNRAQNWVAGALGEA